MMISSKPPSRTAASTASNGSGPPPMRLSARRPAARESSGNAASSVLSADLRSSASGIKGELARSLRGSAPNLAKQSRSRRGPVGHDQDLDRRRRLHLDLLSWPWGDATPKQGN